MGINNPAVCHALHIEGSQSAEKEIPHKSPSMVEKAMESRNADHHARVVDEDAVLLVRAGRGDRAAFDRLYHKYYRMVTSYLARRNGCHDMLEDLVQEVFTRLWQNRKQFSGRSSAKSYIHGIAKYVLSEQKKRFSKQSAGSQNELRRYLSVNSHDSSAPDHKICSVEIKNTAQQAIARLTSKQMQAIRLSYFSGLSSQRTMAEFANCSVEAFRGRLRQAHRRLRQLLDNIESQECCFGSE
ncbi:MAG: RNA polymerase sigma factor [Planctomycetota bacterium]